MLEVNLFTSDSLYNKIRYSTTGAFLFFAVSVIINIVDHARVCQIKLCKLVTN